ncbi:Hypothetical protein A7982_02045 [Minicystis rosea]|nr:Hypothetical protein A7982_02045 [Minicystis rosea]
MLQLRRAQKRMFAEAAERAFVGHLCAHLRARGARLADGLADEELASRVERGVARARSRGLTWSSSIATFVVLLFEVSPRFDEHPRIRAALAGARPDERMLELDRWMTQADWIEARRGDRGREA